MSADGTVEIEISRKTIVSVRTKSVSVAITAHDGADDTFVRFHHNVRGRSLANRVERVLQKFPQHWSSGVTGGGGAQYFVGAPMYEVVYGVLDAMGVDPVPLMAAARAKADEAS